MDKDYEEGCLELDIILGIFVIAWTFRSKESQSSTQDNLLKKHIYQK